jgi:PaREP6 domain containing protein
LLYYIETGDVYVASRIAGMSVAEFNELRIKARVPSVT